MFVSDEAIKSSTTFTFRGLIPENKRMHMKEGQESPVKGPNYELFLIFPNLWSLECYIPLRHNVVKVLKENEFSFSKRVLCADTAHN